MGGVVKTLIKVAVAVAIVAAIVYSAGAVMGAMGVAGAAGAATSAFSMSSVLMSIGKIVAGQLIMGLLVKRKPTGTDAGSASPSQGGKVQLGPASTNKIPVVYGTSIIRPSIIDAKISTDQQYMWFVCVLAEKTSGDYTCDHVDEWGATTPYMMWGDKKMRFDASDKTKVISLLDLTNNVASTGKPVEDTKVNGLINVWFFPNGSTSGQNVPGGATFSAQSILSDATTGGGIVTNCGRWTSAQAMTNTAFAIVRMKYNQDANLTGMAQLSVKMKNTLTNPGDVLYDYLTNTIYGGKLPVSMVDTTAIDNLRTYSNTLISYTETALDGSTSTKTQPRYTINGGIDTNRSVFDNVLEMTEACDSWLNWDEQNGKWSIVINQRFQDQGLAVADLFTIYCDTPLAAHGGTNPAPQANYWAYATGPVSVNYLEQSQTYNKVEAQFPQKYLLDKTDFVYINLTSNLMTPNERENKLSLGLSLVDNTPQAQYLATRRLAMARDTMLVKLTADYSAIQCEAGDIIRVYNKTYGWTNATGFIDGKLFRVMQIIEDTNGEGALTVQLTLAEYNDSVYTIGTINDFVLSMNTGLTNPRIITKPTNVAVIDSYEFAVIPYFNVSVTCPTLGNVHALELWYYEGAPGLNDTTLNGVEFKLLKTQFPKLSSIYKQSEEVAILVSDMPKSKDNTKYYFKVRAVGEFTKSDYSDITDEFFWTPLGPTSSDQNVVPGTLTPGTTTYNWTHTGTYAYYPFYQISYPSVNSDAQPLDMVYYDVQMNNYIGTTQFNRDADTGSMSTYISVLASSIGYNNSTVKKNWVNITNVESPSSYFYVSNDSMNFNGIVYTVDSDTIEYGDIITRYDGVNVFVLKPKNQSLKYRTNLADPVTGLDTWHQLNEGSGSKAWTTIDTSANGLMTIASAYNEYISTSIDGISWTPIVSLGKHNWKTTSVSNSGTKLLAVSDTSASLSIDSGTTWNNLSIGTNTVTKGKISKDGNKIAIKQENENFKLSIDNGSTWLQAITDNVNKVWNNDCVASNASTEKIIAGSTDYIYISTNYGANWTKITSLGVRNWISVACSDDFTRLLVVSTSAVYLSLDSGITWTLLTNVGTGNTQATLSKTGTTIVLKKDSEGILVSSDNGANWYQYTGGSLQGDWVAPVINSDGSIMYNALRNGYIYKSIDGGINWTSLVNSGINNWVSMAINSTGTIIYACTSTLVFKSINSGSTWTQVLSSPLASFYDIKASVNGTYVAILSNGTTFISANSGSTWSTPSFTSSNVNTPTIAMTASGDKIAIVLRNNSLSLSTNYGVSFVSKTPPIVSSDLRVHICGNDIYISDTTRLYKSIDNGTTWNLMLTLSANEAMFSPYTLISNTAGTTIKLIANVMSQEYEKVYTSTNSGVTWINDSTTLTTINTASTYKYSSSSDLSKYMISEYDVSNVNPYNGYIIISSDSINWSGNFPTPNIYHLQATETAIYGVSGSNILKTIDNGKTWTNIWQLYTMRDYKISADGTYMLAISNDKLTYSINSGTTWNQYTTPAACDYCAISSNGQSMFAFRYGSAYISTNYGSTWVSLSTSLLPSLNSAVISTTGNKITCLSTLSSGDVYLSKNIGQNWGTNIDSKLFTKFEMNTDASLISACSSPGYVFVSIDYGQTWIKTIAGYGSYQVADIKNWKDVSIDEVNIVVYTIEGEVYISYNSGINWTKSTSIVYDYILLKNNIYYAIANNSLYSSSNFTNLSSSPITSAGIKPWTSITVSNDNTKLFATATLEYISSSSNSGTTWDQFIPLTDYTTFSIANSVHPTIANAWGILTFSTDGYLYYSNNTGINWTKLTSAGNKVWKSVKIMPVPNGSPSTTKHVMYACAENDYIYKSTDSGTTWTALTSAGSRNWSYIYQSGTVLFALAYGDYIYKSTDNGTIWTTLTSAGARNWISISTPYGTNGVLLVATVYNAYNYTSTDSGVTWIEETSAGARNWTKATIWATGSPTTPYEILAADHGVNNAGGYIYYRTTYIGDNDLDQYTIAAKLIPYQATWTYAGTTPSTNLAIGNSSILFTLAYPKNRDVKFKVVALSQLLSGGLDTHNSISFDSQLTRTITITRRAS